MVDGVFRLASSDEPSMEALLERDPIVNLFLIGFLAAHPAERSWWYGVGRPLRALVLVMPSRLTVPFAPDPADAERLGAHLAEQHTPSLLVGPREAVDVLWGRWSGGAARFRCRHDQHLYKLDRETQRPLSTSGDPPGYRLAQAIDRDAIAAGSAEMELQDTGVNPRDVDAVHHLSVVTERIRAGRTHVIARNGEIVFQVNVGTTHSLGCQIGGTWVPPIYRGQGLATIGIAATCKRLLSSHPCVTLHVNERNIPAVRVYERVGFQKVAPFRLIVP